MTILALAVAALGVDRVFLGGGETTPRRARGETAAEAAESASPATSDPADESAAPPAAKPAPGPLAERLRDLSRKQGIDTNSVRDGFACPQVWLPKRQPSQQQAALGGAAGLEEFRSQHKLMAVMAGARDSAIVDGECLLVGQKLGNFELISVGKRSAVFQCGGRQVTLMLEDES